MKHKMTAVILATGVNRPGARGVFFGQKSLLWIGPGNVPCLSNAVADVPTAVARIF